MVTTAPASPGLAPAMLTAKARTKRITNVFMLLLFKIRSSSQFLLKINWFGSDHPLFLFQEYTTGIALISQDSKQFRIGPLRLMNILGNLKIPARVFFDLLNGYARVVRCQVHFLGFGVKAQDTNGRTNNAGASPKAAVFFPFPAPIKKAGRRVKIDPFREALLLMEHHDDCPFAARSDVI